MTSSGFGKARRPMTDARLFLSVFTPATLMSRLWYWSRRCSLVLSRKNSSFAPKLNSATDVDAQHFSKILSSPTSVLSTLPSVATPSEELDIYNNDWMGKYHGKSTTVLRPKSTQEVSEIVKWCNDKRIGIVPQGGNTGLVGGSVPLKDEVILSLSNMTQVRSFDPISGIVIVCCYLLAHCCS